MQRPGGRQLEHVWHRRARIGASGAEGDALRVHLKQRQARLLLRRQGYAATGLSEIIALSGAPKGSLYFHFPAGKEQLAVAAMERSGDQLRGAIAGILSAHTQLGEALGALVDTLAVGLSCSDYRDGCPIATVTLEAAASSEAVRAAAAEVFDSWLEVLELRLREGGLEPPRARSRALLVLSALEGALILARAQRDPEPLHAVRQEIVALSG